MIACEDAKPLILREIDGTLAPAWRAALDRHLAVCAACRETADTQRVVSSILRDRPDVPIPAAFALEMAERLDAERTRGWGHAANWRQWSLRLVPLAAAAAILAAVIPQRRHEAADVEASAALVSMAAPQGGLLILTAPSANDDAALVVLLANDLWRKEQP